MRWNACRNTLGNHPYRADTPGVISLRNMAGGQISLWGDVAMATGRLRHCAVTRVGCLLAVPALR
jgi:hypothetical protein